MTVSVANRCQVSDLRCPCTADPIQSERGVPRLWPELPAEVRQQLAQQIARLLQRLRSPAGQSEEENRAEHGGAC